MRTFNLHIGLNFLFYFTTIIFQAIPSEYQIFNYVHFLFYRVKASKRLSFMNIIILTIDHT